MKVLAAAARRLIVTVLAVVGAAAVVVACTPLANLLFITLDRISSRPAPADAIVVLAGGRYGDGTLNGAALERTVTAVILYRRGLAPRLLFSGGPCCGRSTSSLMGALARDLGVPGEAIRLEEQSRRTHDAAVHVGSVARAEGWRSVILVTSAVHMLRARLAFVAAGVPVVPVKATERADRLVTTADERIALLKASLHEYLGLGLYKVRGWI
jgi:uncharacterized SAM-binding protein YcdF (DUF218 family)